MMRNALAIAVSILFLAAGSRGADSAYNGAVLDDEPLFYWTFDEPDGDPAVNSVRPAAAADFLLPEVTAARIDQAAGGGDALLGRAADFDGLPGTRFYGADIGGSLQPPGAGSIASGIWAIEFWFQVQGANDGERADYFLESWGAAGSNDPGIIYDFTPTESIELFKGSRTGSAGPQVSDDAWHHIVLAYYGDGAGLGVANRRDIYLDGSPFTENFSGFSSTFALAELAVGNTVAGGGVNGFEGRIDEVAVYDVGANLVDGGLDISFQNPDAEGAMEAFVSELSAHAGLAQDPGYGDLILEGKPLFYWSFDEPGDADDAVNLADPADARDRLVAQGAATRVSHEAIASGLLLGRSASFDGADGTRFYATDLDAAAEQPGIDVIPTQLWALEMWVQVQGDIFGARPDYLLESFGGGANDPGIIYDYTAPDYIELFRGNRTGTAGPQISDDRWHHLVFAFYGNSGGFGVADRRDILLDGRPFTERSSNFSSGFSLMRLGVGNSVGGPLTDGFQGRIDELAIYDIGAKLVEAGYDISGHNADGEAGFEALVLDIADHRKLVSISCTEEFDSVTISGPADGALGAPVTLTAELTGVDPGATAAYDWSIVGGPGTMNESGATTTLSSTEPGEVTVQVAADDGICPESQPAKAVHRVCFETPDGASISGPDRADAGAIVTLTAEISGFDEAPYEDTSSGFSSGFGLVQIAIGNTSLSGGVNGFQGNMDEVAIYDIGKKLQEDGIDISVRTPEAEAAFAAAVREIAAHAALRGAAYSEAVISAGPEFYWNFDEGGEIDDAVNAMDPFDSNDNLLAQGSATRKSHANMGNDLELGQAAVFDGADGTRFYAPDLNGPGTDPGVDALTSGLWAMEFWFQVVDGQGAANRGDYLCEVIGPNDLTNNPGIIYDFDFDPGDGVPRGYLEMFGGGGRTGSAGPVVDEAWHHAVFAYYGNSAGLGVANRREIFIDGGKFASYVWSIASGSAELGSDGGTASVLCTGLPGEQVVVRVEARDGPCGGAAAEHTITVGGQTEPTFRRGDTDDSGKMDLTDAVRLLGYLFLGTGTVPCMEAADSDDSGKLDLTDAILILSYLFLGGDPPVDPGPPPASCGPDPAESPQDIGCESYGSC